MKKGLRRVGIVGLSTLVAGSMMTGLAVTASAAAGDFALVAGTTPNVTQGGAGQAARSVSLDFANDFASGNVQTFQIKRGAAANVCTTASGIASAIEFGSIPTRAFTGPFLANGTTAGTAGVTPAGVVTLTSSSTACATAGITDVATLTLSTTATGPVTDTWRVTLSGITYNVGATAAVGAVNVTTAGDLATTATSLVNANVVLTSNASMPVVVAQSLSSANTLGTVSFVETSPGVYFPANTDTTVTLQLTTGTFTAGVTPTIVVPTGYTVIPAAPATTSSNLYTFHVTAPLTVTAPATVTVAGLQLTTLAGGYLEKLTADTNAVSAPAPVAMNAAKVLDYSARNGGTSRYDTAADLFTSNFPSATTAVLSSGVNFPDALSASYLAGRLSTAVGGTDTGILLTAPSSLSTAAKTVISGAGTLSDITTVYITGETLAVSQNVQNQIEAMHVGNSPAAALINVIRLGGQNRYATNQVMNEYNFGARPVRNTVLLASGQNFPDALALGPIANFKQFPLILTKGVTLGANENAQLSDFNPTNVIIAGGPLVVSSAIEANLVSRGFKVLRLMGTRRTQTAAAIDGWATVGVAPATSGTIQQAQGMDSTTTYIARGDIFPDALAAGPAAGNVGFLIALTDSPTALGAGIPEYLGTKTVAVTAPANRHVDVLNALGLTLAMSNANMKAAAESVGVAP